MNSNKEEKNSDIVAYSQLSKGRKRRAVIRFIIIALLGALFVAVTLFLLLNRYFVVKTLIIDGTEKYSFNELSKCALPNDKTLIFTLSESKVENELKAKFPFVESVQLEKKYPSTVYITVNEEKPLFYVEIEGEYYVITDSLKVLLRYQSRERMIEDYPALKELKTTKIYKAIAPNRIEFMLEKDQKYISEALKELSSWKDFDKIKDVDISNKFEINVNFDDRISIKLGNRYDFKEKLHMASIIVSSFSDKATGTLNLKDIKEAIEQISEPEESN